MNLCMEDHEEVCYDGRECPACAVRREMQDRLDEQTKALVDMTDERDALLREEP